MLEELVPLDHQRLHLLFLLGLLPVVQAHPVLQLLLNCPDLLLQCLHLRFLLLVALLRSLVRLPWVPLLLPGLLPVFPPHFLVSIVVLLYFLLEDWPVGLDWRIALVFGPQEFHEHHCSLLDDLPLDEFERVSVDLEAHELHESQDSGQSGEVVVFEVEVVEALLAEDVVRDVVDDVVADIEYLEEGQAVLEEQQFDGADLVVGEVQGAQFGHFQDGLGHLGEAVGGVGRWAGGGRGVGWGGECVGGAAEVLRARVGRCVVGGA